MSNGLKPYLYISDAKINMFFGQLSSRPITPDEVKFGPPFFSVTTKGELEPEQRQRVKLEKVVDWIKRYGNLGTIDEPSEYVHGTLDMRWGPFLDDDAMGDDQIVWFGGATDRTVVGLAGSAHHVIGNMGQSQAWSRSNLPSLIPHLFEAIGKDPIHQIDKEEWWVEDHRQQAHQGVYIATTRMKGIPQRVEFVALKLLFGKSYYRPESLVSDRNILLASPLYVAQVFDPYSDK